MRLYRWAPAQYNQCPYKRSGYRLVQRDNHVRTWEEDGHRKSGRGLRRNQPCRLLASRTRELSSFQGIDAACPTALIVALLSSAQWMLALFKAEYPAPLHPTGRFGALPLEFRSGLVASLATIMKEK